MERFGRTEYARKMKQKIDASPTKQRKKLSLFEAFKAHACDCQLAEYDTNLHRNYYKDAKEPPKYRQESIVAMRNKQRLSFLGGSDQTSSRKKSVLRMSEITKERMEELVDKRLQRQNCRSFESPPKKALIVPLERADSN